jgi:DNA-binding response OmpR family regulator
VSDEKQIRLAALNSGADDYVTRPFDMDELEARIRGVLRRTAREVVPSWGGEIRIGDLVIDLDKSHYSYNEPGIGYRFADLQIKP